MVEFSKEELGVIKERMSKITSHIPNHQAKWLWDTYNRIKGTNEKQPAHVEVLVTYGRKVWIQSTYS